MTKVSAFLLGFTCMTSASFLSGTPAVALGSLLLYSAVATITIAPLMGYSLFSYILYLVFMGGVMVLVGYLAILIPETTKGGLSLNPAFLLPNFFFMLLLTLSLYFIQQKSSVQKVELSGVNELLSSLQHFCSLGFLVTFLLVTLMATLQILASPGGSLRRTKA